MYDTVVFDLLTALLDSWTLWNRAAGSDHDGFRWRRAYLQLTYGCGAYRRYEDLVREAANRRRPGRNARERPHDLLGRASAVARRRLRSSASSPPAGIRFGVGTNCSIELGRRAAARVGMPFAAVLTAEESGFYKPRPRTLSAASRPSRCRAREDPLRRGGSPQDIPGATRVGMSVFWHNRAGVSFVADDARPILVADTLYPILDLVR